MAVFRKGCCRRPETSAAARAVADLRALESVQGWKANQSGQITLPRNRWDKMCRRFPSAGRERITRPPFSLVIRVVPRFFLERWRFGECDSNAGNGSDASFPFGKARFEEPSRFLTNLSLAWNPDHFVITKRSFVVIV